LIDLPSSYYKHTCGLCGNFNLKPEDDIPQSGTDLAAVVAWAQGWKEFWADETCQSRCRCDPDLGMVVCKEAGCKLGETCAMVKGVRRCVAKSHSTCVATGDPHYTTFDGRRYDFMGTCVYQLAALCSDDPTLVPFNVTVENNNRGSRVVSYTKEVTLNAYNMTLSLSQAHPQKLKVNGILVDLPFNHGDKLRVFLKGVHGFIKTDFEVVVTFDWYSYARVILPNTYSRAVCGLCGNADGDPQDDFALPDGQQVADPIQFADSWKVADVPGCGAGCTEGCKVCTEAEKRAYRGDKHCGLLVKQRGPFAACHSTVDPTPYFDDCLFDTCLYEGHQETVCRSLSAYVTACQSRGVRIKPWRTFAFCSPVCPPNQHYELCGPSCPATCRGQEAAEECEDEAKSSCAEGCFCDQGFLLSGDRCVPLSRCGCWHRERYYQAGEEFFSCPRCSERCACRGGGAVECQPADCGAAEACGVQDGVLGCYPQDCGRCQVLGPVSYSTFDGRPLRFAGTCAYAAAVACTRVAFPEAAAVARTRVGNSRGRGSRMHRGCNSRGRGGRMHQGCVSRGRGGRTHRGWQFLRPQRSHAPGLSFPRLRRSHAPGLCFPRLQRSHAPGLRFPRLRQSHAPGLRFPRLRRSHAPGLQFPRPQRSHAPGLAIPEAAAVACTGVAIPKAAALARTGVAFPEAAAVARTGVAFPEAVAVACTRVAFPEAAAVARTRVAFSEAAAVARTRVAFPEAAAVACTGVGNSRGHSTRMHQALSCPPNSRYELCTRSCDYTCAGLSAGPRCTDKCFEGCRCHEGFLFNGAECVPAGSCGCLFHGRYFEIAETVLSPDCSQSCTCRAAGGMHCRAAACPFGQVCGLEDGVRGCVEQPGRCTLAPAARFASFDGATGPTTATGVYVLAALCDHLRPNWFRLLADVGENQDRPTVVALHLFSPKAFLTVKRDKKVWVNGVPATLPVEVSKGLTVKETRGTVWITQEPEFVIGLSPAGEVTATVARDLSQRLCGMCGNYDGDAANDLQGPDGKLAGDAGAAAKAWRAPDFTRHV
ncbi:FCGBP protein, partial [Glareola pratincola]|nr:FCGBP protein [Glareola pratincola]